MSGLPDAVDRRAKLVDLAGALPDDQVELLVAIGSAMSASMEVETSPTSDLLTAPFTRCFSNQLLLHHATHKEKFKKKAFEFAFRRACEAAGRDASIVSSQTNPGADVVVDETRFSLKTEAAASIQESRITISKLMEARWIRECRTREDFARETSTRVTAHLNDYQRIITLRAFDMPPSRVRYDMIEIPVDLLREVRNLGPADFSERTPNGGSRAAVRVGGGIAFRIRLDGSVEKVTISALDTARCNLHASWIIPNDIGV